jgi:hypothetical protein
MGMCVAARAPAAIMSLTRRTPPPRTRNRSIRRPRSCFTCMRCMSLTEAEKKLLATCESLFDEVNANEGARQCAAGHIASEAPPPLWPMLACARRRGGARR